MNMKPSLQVQVPILAPTLNLDVLALPSNKGDHEIPHVDMMIKLLEAKYGAHTQDQWSYRIY